MASEKITAMIEEIKTLSVLELSELVKAVEEEFDVSAAAAVTVAAPAAGGAGAAAAFRCLVCRHGAWHIPPSFHKVCIG
mgnify:FL=1